MSELLIRVADSDSVCDMWCMLFSSREVFAVQPAVVNYSSADWLIAGRTGCAAASSQPPKCPGSGLWPSGFGCLLDWKPVQHNPPCSRHRYARKWKSEQCLVISRV